MQAWPGYEAKGDLRYLDLFSSCSRVDGGDSDTVEEQESDALYVDSDSELECSAASLNVGDGTFNYLLN